MNNKKGFFSLLKDKITETNVFGRARKAAAIVALAGTMAFTASQQSNFNNNQNDTSIAFEDEKDNDGVIIDNTNDNDSLNDEVTDDKTTDESKNNIEETDNNDNNDINDEKVEEKDQEKIDEENNETQAQDEEENLDESKTNLIEINKEDLDFTKIYGTSEDARNSTNPLKNVNSNYWGDNGAKLFYNPDTGLVIEQQLDGSTVAMGYINEDSFIKHNHDDNIEKPDKNDDVKEDTIKTIEHEDDENTKDDEEDNEKDEEKIDDDKINPDDLIDLIDNNDENKDNDDKTNDDEKINDDNNNNNNEKDNENIKDNNTPTNNSTEGSNSNDNKPSESNNTSNNSKTDDNKPSDNTDKTDENTKDDTKKHKHNYSKWTYFSPTYEYRICLEDGQMQFQKHNYSDIKYNPTTHMDECICASCGHKITKIHTHNYEWEYLDNESELGKCTVNGDTLTLTRNHTVDSYVYNPETGLDEGICSTCGHKITKAHEHNYEWEYLDNENEQGTCTINGDTVTITRGHTVDNWTYIGEGKEQGHCSTCDHDIERNHEHTFTTYHNYSIEQEESICDGCNEAKDYRDHEFGEIESTPVEGTPFYYYSQTCIHDGCGYTKDLGFGMSPTPQSITGSHLNNSTATIHSKKNYLTTLKNNLISYFKKEETTEEAKKLTYKA